MKPRWGLGLTIGLVTGLALWAMSGPPFEIRPQMPLFLWVWAPVIVTGILIYAEMTAGKKTGWWWKIAGSVGLMTLYAVWMPQWLGGAANRQFENLMLTHLPLMAWVGVGGYVLGRKGGQIDRFAFLIKSGELMVTAGLFLAVGGVFMGVTTILFETMKITIPEVVLRLGVSVGMAMIAMAAVMIGYDPKLTPREQNFKAGIYPILALAVRLFIPLVLFVLAAYMLVIPFNFWVPFNDREALVAFNAVLAAVIVLLIGATPRVIEDIPQPWRVWLRRGIMTTAGLAVIITLYALAAAIYRTYIDQWTINRVVIMGWNLINLTVLSALVFGQVRAGQGWLASLQQTWARAMVGWAGWVIGLIVILPWFFY